MKNVLKIALMVASLLLAAQAGALVVVLQDEAGNPLPEDARWRVQGYEEGVWYESGASNNIGSFSDIYTFYFIGKNVAWPDYLVTNILNPHSATLVLQHPTYTNAISVIVRGLPIDSRAKWRFIAYPDALSNSTSFRTEYENSFALYPVSTNTLPAMPHGLYKVMPERVRGYNTPAGVIVDVTGDPLTNVVNLTYMPYSNTLAVTVYGYPVSNCEWSVVGPDDFTNAISYQATYTNNALITGVPTGRYAFNFPGVLGYATPTNTIDITGAQPTSSVEAAYVLTYPTNIPSGGGIQKFFQPCYFLTNVYLHDSGMPLHLRLGASGGGNAEWGQIGGLLSDQVDLQDALNGKASSADIVAVSSRVDNAETAIAATAADVVVVSGRVAVAEGAITATAADVLSVSQRIDAAEADIATNTARIVALSNRVDNIPTPTNQIITVDGVAFVITNTPTSAGDVLVFDPATTTACFVAQSGGLTVEDVQRVAPLMVNQDDVRIGAGGYCDTYGVAIGKSAHGINVGVALGWNAMGSFYGTAVGKGARGNSFGAALGYEAKGQNRAVALGADSYAISNAASLGAYVSNNITGTTRTRGDLYLDGGTKIYTRPDFGSGEFTELSTGGGAPAGTYPVFAIPLGGNWTDFEIKASTNNFASLVYYYKSWTPTQDATRGDTNAYCYFTDDHAGDVRVWNLKPQTNAISQVLVSTNSEVETVYFYPSHDCAVAWEQWMQQSNTALKWSFVRVDDVGFEMNASGTKQHWSPIRPDSWEAARTTP